jgi:hypothetical protein
MQNNHRNPLCTIRTGRGRKFPIAKAALIWFFEGWKNGERGKFNTAPTSWDWGQYGSSHEIIDIAGAKNVGPNTTFCVSSALARSPLWNKEFYRNFYRGIGSANIYTPSEKGKEWFKKYKNK